MINNRVGSKIILEQKNLSHDKEKTNQTISKTKIKGLFKDFRKVTKHLIYPKYPKIHFLFTFTLP